MTVSVLEELRAIGVEVVTEGENLVICPASKVPPELKQRLRAHKAEVLEALRNRPAISSPEARAKLGAAIMCRYDWQPGYQGQRLHCVAHQHAAGTATVFRVTSDAVLRALRRSPRPSPPSVRAHSRDGVRDGLIRF